MVKVLIVGAALALAGASLPAMAAPTMVGASGGTPALTPISDGCGRGWHRDYYGVCRPNRDEGPPLGPALGYPCPPNYHPGPNGRRCFPN